MIALITLIAYNAAMVAIGLWAARKARSSDQFFLADRGLGPVVAGLAYSASTSSAWVLLGFSGFVYAAGPSALWMVPGILAGYAALWLGAGPILQTASRTMGHLTLTDFLCEDAGPRAGRAIRVLASLLIAFCFSYYVAAQFQGAGTAFDGLFGTGLGTGVVLGALVVLAYVFLGGFLAVSVIDTIQGLLMALVAAALPTVAFLAAGGVEGLAAALAQAPQTYRDGFGGMVGFTALGFVVGLMATGFGALGQPHLTAWIMAARDRRARVTGAAVAILWGGGVYLGMAVLGLSGRAIFGADMAAEGVFFALADQVLPAAAGGLIAAAMLSAIMSTVDSQLLVAGAAMSHDLGLKRWLGGREVLASRVAILALSVLAVALTLFLPSTIFERTLFAWTALGAAFGPTVIARALGIRAGGVSVLISILAGFAACLAFELGVEAGPADVWARTLPWLLAAMPLVLGARIGARWTSQARLS